MISDDLEHISSADNQYRQELDEINIFTLGDTEKFEIAGKQKVDSTGNPDWKAYMDRKKLLGAWLPPAGSPYTRFVKTKTLNSVEVLKGRITPRYYKADIECVRVLTEQIINNNQTGKDVAVILNPGGSHSIAMGAKLIKHGYQPIVMMDSIPHSKGSVGSEQELATFVYFAREVDQTKKDGLIKPDMPPVFILDAHREDSPMPPGSMFYSPDKKDNSHTFSAADFPSAEELQRFNIRKVIYINEADLKGELDTYFEHRDMVDDDLQPIMDEWQIGGIEISCTGIDPYPHQSKKIRHLY